MRGRGHSSLLVAVVSAVTSALVVCAVFLGAGAFDSEPRPQRAVARATPQPPAASPRDIYRRTRLAIVLVEHRPPGVKPRTGPPRRDDGIATGSGFVISGQGHVVTNQHVVAGRGKTTVQFDADEDPVDATIVGRDASTDLAVVKVASAEVARLEPLALAASAQVRIGDAAIAIGNPFGLERSLTVGVVSATDRSINAPNRKAKIRNAVQTDAPINPGNSGGPLLDAQGRVIGVISQARGNGIGFAVPADTVKRVVAALRRDGRVVRAPRDRRP